MTITDFTTLTLPDQLEFLYAEGVYLHKRKTADESVILYQLNQLYIEIHYEKYRHFVSHLRCSNNADILDPYLETICVNDIFA